MTCDVLHGYESYYPPGCVGNPPWGEGCERCIPISVIERLFGGNLLLIINILLVISLILLIIFSIILIKDLLKKRRRKKKSQNKDKTTSLNTLTH